MSKWNPEQNDYNKIAEVYNVNKEIVSSVIDETIFVRRGKTFEPSKNHLSLLFKGALYAYGTEDNERKVKCLISNTFYENYFAPVEYDDEHLKNKIKPDKYDNAINESNMIIKASSDSYIFQINIKKLSETTNGIGNIIKRIIQDYYIEFPRIANELHEIMQINNIGKRKNYVMGKYPNLSQEYDQNIIADFFGARAMAWYTT